MKAVPRDASGVGIVPRNSRSSSTRAIGPGRLFGATRDMDGDGGVSLDRDDHPTATLRPPIAAIAMTARDTPPRGRRAVRPPPVEPEMRSLIGLSFIHSFIHSFARNMSTAEWIDSRASRSTIHRNPLTGSQLGDSWSIASVHLWATDGSERNIRWTRWVETGHAGPGYRSGATASESAFHSM